MKILLYFIAFTILTSCTVNNEKIVRNHELLELIIRDRQKLEHHVSIYNVTDTISIGKLNFVSESFSNISVDSSTYDLIIFQRQYPSIPAHPFFQESIDYVMEQIRMMESTIWNENLIQTPISLFQIRSETYKKFTNPYLAAIQLNKDSLDLVAISEPLENIKGQLFVSAKIFTRKYSLDKFYLFERKNNKWTIIGTETLIGKYERKRNSDTSTEEYEVCVGYTK